MGKDGKYLIKIGCTNEEDIHVRIKKQITASNPEKYELLYVSPNVKFDDHKVHINLEKYGEYRLNPRKEWFVTEEDTIKRAVNEALGLSSRQDSFKMRPDQQKAVDKAYKYFTENKGNIFLWDAKMRFGKTFCAYQLIKKLKAKKVLVVTYKPAIVKEWENGLNNHVDFEEYKFIKALDAKKNEILLSDHDVLFVSFQDILQYFKIDKDNFLIKPRFSNLFNECFDLVIIDEVHFGATNDPAQEFLKKLNYKKILYLSGTPFKLINKGDLSEDQIFSYTYIDEQNRKNDLLNEGFNSVDDKSKRFNQYLSMPKMTIIGYELGKRAFNDAKYYDEEEKFSFAKFFNSEDGKTFEHQQAANHFLDIISDKKSDASPFFAENIEILKHTLWLLPNVNSVYALYHTLKNHSFFKNYDIIPASSNNLGKGRDTLRLVKNSINGSDYNGKKGTITLSCEKLTTGVTVKEWNAVFLLTNTISMEFYYQSAARAQSPNVDQNKIDYKKNCYVFDFDSDRMIKMIYNYAKKHNKDQSTVKNIREMLSTMNLLCYTDNSFINLEVNDILSMAKNGIGDAILQKKFESRLLLNADVINNMKFNDNLMVILENLKMFRKVSNSKDEYEIVSGLGKGKTFCVTKNSYDTDRKIKDKTDKIIKEVLQRLLTRLPIFMYLSEYVEEKIEDVIENLEPDLFEEVTGIEVSKFTMLKEYGVFDIEKLNEAISAFKICERDSLITHQNSSTDILNVMANLSNEEVFTPVSRVNEVLDTLPTSVWCNPNLKWCNPAIKNGIWLREVYKRLFKGLEDLIIDPKRREYHIKKNMLYGYTTSNIAWMMACKTICARVDEYDDKHIRWKDSEYINNIKNKRFLEEENTDMPKFDAVIGNPPYQKDSSGFGAQATPLYNLFVEKIIDEINPEYFSFIIESRWFTGGMGLNSFRKRMLSDRSIKLIKDYKNAKSIFPSISDIKGGVCYFLREKSYTGVCKFISDDGNTWNNDLSQYDVVIREKTMLKILDKVFNDDTFVPLSNRVLPINPCNLPTNFNNFLEDTSSIVCLTRNRQKRYINSESFKDKFSILGKWKTFYAEAQSPLVLKNPNVFVGSPEEVTTATYIVLGVFSTEVEADNLTKYAKTKFFESMLKIRAITQHVNKNKFTFVPDQLDYTKEYTDEYLYKKYGLTKEEVEFIESKFE